MKTILLFLILLTLISRLPPMPAKADKPASIDPPAYCYSNVRGMGFPCADLKGEFNV